jgi:hypothetical protein
MGKQPSTIDLLPADIKNKLQELLRDPRVTQLQATAKINAILEAEGHEDRLSKSAVNRYALRMEEVGAKLRQSREVAEMWVGKLGAQPQGQVGHLLNEMVRTLAFDCAMTMSEGDEPIPPKMLKDLSIAVERLEKAASENVKREEEIRKQERERAADQAAKIAKKGGLSADTVDTIRREILGIAN